MIEGHKKRQDRPRCVTRNRMEIKVDERDKGIISYLPETSDIKNIPHSLV